MHCGKQSSAWTELSPIFLECFFALLSTVRPMHIKNSRWHGRNSRHFFDVVSWLAVYCAALSFGEKRASAWTELSTTSPWHDFHDCSGASVFSHIQLHIVRQISRKMVPKAVFFMVWRHFWEGPLQGPFCEAILTKIPSSFLDQFWLTFHIMCSMLFKHFFGRPTRRD